MSWTVMNFEAIAYAAQLEREMLDKRDAILDRLGPIDPARRPGVRGWLSWLFTSGNYRFEDPKPAPETAQVVDEAVPVARGPHPHTPSPMHSA